MSPSPSFAACARALQAEINRFDPASVSRRKTGLLRMLDSPVVPGKPLVNFLYSLLFTIAYPSDRETLRLAERLLRRLVRNLAHDPRKDHVSLANSTLPFCCIVGRFSHDALRSLLTQERIVTVSLHNSRFAPSHVATLVKLTLPEAEKGYVPEDLDDNRLLDALGVPPAKRVAWLVGEAAKLDAMPVVKDFLFDQLGLYVRLTPRKEAFSIAYNRMPAATPFFHSDKLRHVDVRTLADTPLPAPMELSDSSRDQIIRIIRNAMALLARETDPATYLDPRSLRIYSLERGLQVAYFTMVPERQLPYESYIGYTAFKNSLPIAYGGAWIFGDRALFGINIFPPYRGGESAYLMGQLLRGYRQLFNIAHVEIEPFQFGLDNPEGIATGAFWFYYRSGFRPADIALRKLAEDTFHRMGKKAGYTCPVKTLEAFTASPLAMSFTRPLSSPVNVIIDRIAAMIRKRFRGDRVRAVASSRAALLPHLPETLSTNPAYARALDEMAMWAAASRLYRPEQLRCWPDVIRLRASDAYAYQKAVSPLTMRQKKHG